METLIGFVVGYLMGTRHGRDGLAKMRESLDAIRSSPEVHQLVATGVSVAGSATRSVLSGGAGAMLNGVVESITRKAAVMTGTSEENRAA
jgi:hypothetical protein